MRPSGARKLFIVLSVVTIGAFLVESFLYFPLSVPYMKDLSAGAPLLDMRFGYTPDAAYRLFEVLGQKGRDNYVKLLWTIDLLLPAIFALFLSSVIRRGVFRAWQSIPFLAAACDYVENIAITLLLLQYPVHGPGIVRFASLFTVTKLGLYSVGLLLSLGSFLLPESQRSLSRVNT